MDSEPNVVLIGMPAVGKSTLGVLLAKELAYAFVDTDLLIQAGTGQRLMDLMQEHGREGFCQIEEGYVCNLECQGTVIATGGSVVYSEIAMAQLKRNAAVLYLRAPLEILEERLDNPLARGVVMAPGQTFADLWEERRPLYEKYADATVDVDDLPPYAAVQALVIVLCSLGCWDNCDLA